VTRALAKDALGRAVTDTLDCMHLSAFKVVRISVTVSPSPQPEDTTEEKLHTLRKYAHDFRCQHMTDAEYVWNDSDNEDYNLGIGCLVVT
jgi:hypothetical protein